MPPVEDTVPVWALHEKYECDPEAGMLTHKFRAGATPGERMFNSCFAGRRAAGSPQTGGYLQLRLTDIQGNGRNVLVHRIIWAMTTGEWPADQLDHRDTNKQNNAFANLRECGNAENKRNSLPRRDNKVGLKGVSKESRGNKFAAQICVDGQVTHIGTFADPRDAARAYDCAANQHFGEFARTNAAMGLL